MTLPVLIPCSYNRLSDPRLTLSIQSTEAQTVFTDITVFGTYGSGIYDRKNIEAEIDCRKKMVNYVRGLPENIEFVAMQDADVIHLEIDNFAEMIARLRTDNTLGAVACSSGSLSHIECACVVIRRTIFSTIHFTTYNNKCVCLSFKNSILLSGKRFEYVDTIKRINH